MLLCLSPMSPQSICRQQLPCHLSCASIPRDTQGHSRDTPRAQQDTEADMEKSSVTKRATAFHSPAFKACFVPSVHLLPSQEDAYLSELSDIAFPFSTPIFLITRTFCLSHGKSRQV